MSKTMINTLRNPRVLAARITKLFQPVLIPQQMLSDVEHVSDDDDEDVHGRGSSKHRNPKFGITHCIREAVPARVSVKMIDFAHSTFEGFMSDPPLHEGPGNTKIVIPRFGTRKGKFCYRFRIPERARNIGSPFGVSIKQMKVSEGSIRRGCCVTIIYYFQLIFLRK